MIEREIETIETTIDGEEAMTRGESNHLSDRLIQADTQDPVSESGADEMFKILLDQELQFERQVQRLALLSWSVTFGCLVLGAVAAGLVMNGGGAFVEVLRVFIMIVFGTGTLTLLAAIITSLTWLFRSRTPTLRAIERRLADLERLLMSR